MDTGGAETTRKRRFLASSCPGRLTMSPGVQRKSRWLVTVLVFLAGYAAAHFALSRCSCAMMRRDWGIDGVFLYLPVRPDFVADNERPLLYVHHALRCFFFPIWKFDHVVLGGPWPMTSMPLRGLSG